MKKQQLQALIQKGAGELAEEIAHRRVRTGTLRVEKAAGKLKNVHEYRQARRDVAQLVTCMKTREVANAES